MEKNIKVSLNIPEGLYRDIERNALDNERTITAELVYRARKYDQVLPIHLGGGDIKQGGTMPEPKKEDLKVDEGWLYGELVEKLGNTLDREVDFEERSKLNKEVKEMGLVWNVYLKRLERFEDGKCKVVHQF